MDLGSRGTVGFVLFLAGTALFAPALFPNTGLVGYLSVLPATLALTYGTYLVGTSVDGDAV